MSEGVDLSQIRGDWKFHMNYLQNAMDRTLERQRRDWAGLGDDADLAASVEQQNKLWADLHAGANDKGTIPTADGVLTEFIAVCRASRDLCNAYQDRNDSAAAEELAESCRQARALCDDFEMMIGQRPDDQ
jgi:hypothetical protein